MKLFLFIELCIFLIFFGTCHEEGELNIRGLMISEVIMNVEIIVLYIMYSILYLPI